MNEVTQITTVRAYRLTGRTKNQLRSMRNDSFTLRQNKVGKKLISILQLHTLQDLIRESKLLRLLQPAVSGTSLWGGGEVDSEMPLTADCSSRSNLNYQ